MRIDAVDIEGESPAEEMAQEMAFTAPLPSGCGVIVTIQGHRGGGNVVHAIREDCPS